MDCNEKYTDFLWIAKYSFKGNGDSFCNLHYVGTKKNFSTKYGNGSQNVIDIPL